MSKKKKKNHENYSGFEVDKRINQRQKKGKRKKELREQLPKRYRIQTSVINIVSREQKVHSILKNHIRTIQIRAKVMGSKTG